MPTDPLRFARFAGMLARFAGMGDIHMHLFSLEECSLAIGQDIVSFLCFCHTDFSFILYGCPLLVTLFLV